MKVLIVSAHSANSNFSYNQRLLNLKEGLRQNDVDATMLYLGKYYFKSPSLARALNIPLILREVEGYDFVHGGSYPASFVLGLMKNFKQFTLINDVHGCIEEARLKMGSLFDLEGYLTYFENFITQEISVRNSDFFITCSKPLKDRLLNRGIRNSSIEVIRNGVDTELFKPRQVIPKGNEFVVTYAGAFQKWQGLENLVSAAKLIKHANVKFKIIGFRRGDKVFKERLSRLFGNRIELIDSLSQTELIDQLCLSDILIIPRQRHCATQMAFPTKFAEYIAVGKPVIVTGVDETATFVKKYDCGFVCEPSAESIAQTVVKASNLSFDRLIEMGRNARNLAESQFDRRVIGKTYSEFLYRVLSP